MRLVNVAHVLLELIKIAVRTENGTAGLVVALKQSVAEANTWLLMIRRRKKRRAANVSQRSIRSESRGKCARIFHTRAALVIEELHSKRRINRRLVGIGDWPRHLIQAESRQQRGF